MGTGYSLIYCRKEKRPRYTNSESSFRYIDILVTYNFTRYSPSFPHPLRTLRNYFSNMSRSLRSCPREVPPKGKNASSKYLAITTSSGNCHHQRPSFSLNQLTDGLNFEFYVVSFHHWTVHRGAGGVEMGIKPWQANKSRISLPSDEQSPEYLPQLKIIIELTPRP
jgi:hypothetical protein